VSKLGYTNLIFIEFAQINRRQYYQEVLLMQELLQVNCSIAGDAFVFQQDNAPTHCAHDMVELLCCETPHSVSNRHMWPANITDLNLVVDYHIL